MLTETVLWTEFLKLTAWVLTMDALMVKMTDLYCRWSRNQFCQIDGDRDGQDDGTSAGQDRDYNIGYGEGQVAGNLRAQEEGEKDGTRTGTIQGNIDAAEREGEEAGIIRANESDASQVGQQQGQVAGLDRAVRTGNTNGTRIGEDEGIAKYENTTLQDSNIDGSYGEL